LVGLVSRDDNYRVFEIGKNLGRARTVEHPKPHIHRFHQRVFTLLSRIEPPLYLHSGVKGRSYITNAKAHRGCSRLVTLDIEAFYPSTRRWHVFEFFNDTMKCSPDVADIMASLLTYEDHVPTGRAASQIAVNSTTVSTSRLKSVGDRGRPRWRCLAHRHGLPCLVPRQFTL